MTAILNFRCPQCNEVLQIESDAVGQSVACPNCEQPVAFEIERALPIDHAEPGEHVHRIGTKDGTIQGKGSEQDLDVRHPAMFRAHPFRWILVASIAVTGIGWGVWAMVEGESEGALFLGGLAAVIVGVVAAGYFFVWWLRTHYTQLRVTSVRTIHRAGFVARKSTEVRHDDVRNLQLEQSALERIVGVGSIAISSAGQDGLEIVAQDIPKPHEVIELIRSHQHSG